MARFSWVVLLLGFEFFEIVGVTAPTISLLSGWGLIVWIALVREVFIYDMSPKTSDFLNRSRPPGKRSGFKSFCRT
jgi:hypothetical protein